MAHNRQVKGASNSAHLSGEAVDIQCNTSYLRFKILYHAINFGIKRIEIGSNWVHVDINKTLPQEVIFLQ